MCPTRSWNFFPEMKETISKEANLQKNENIFKFAPGYGLDASYLMQIVT